jgi:hypothetical protein
MLADAVSDNDLAAVEDAFFKAAGLAEAKGLHCLAKRLAAGRADDGSEAAAEQTPAEQQTAGLWTADGPSS